MRSQIQNPRSSRPAAFTLIELLVAIGIIAVLVGLFSPAIYNVIVKARVSEVKQEIGQIEGAIADFKLKFGMNPPSRIRLYETGDRTAGTGWFENTAQAKWSRSIIRRLWPDFNFELDRDFNQDTSFSGFWDLEGDQCLVFFLGGVWDGDKFAGFSADQRNPFKLSSSGTTTIGPFMDFDAARVVTSAQVTYTAPLVNFPVYVDPLPAQIRPYMYASSNEGLGYDSNDVSTPASNNSFSIYFLKQKAAAADPDPAAWKPETFQIISPGADGEFGAGGPYMPDQTNPLPTLVVGDTIPPAPDRKAERDNITNFSDGVLVP
ncbi:MAG TPA: prepilin-type N-terminal cleavage/methylation domain-containing protein [Planctomycetaceae bacterium]|nr:prepilin-type N-terminal cleavage/methylation domain-containing protein [Planctomycetaceae bacterium]